MTDNEKAFFHRLQRALPGHLAFPQVSFAAFLTDDGKLSQQKRWAIRARFDRKIADFVVCERETLQIVALIELDDHTHSAGVDRQRDEITNAVGYHTLAFNRNSSLRSRRLRPCFRIPSRWRCARRQRSKLGRGDCF